MEKLVVVLISVDDFERKIAENIENQEFKTLDGLIKEIRNGKKDGFINVLPICDFMDACNNQEIELESFWVSYVLLDESL